MDQLAWNKLSVVVIGAGFGGLEVVRALRSADADVTLIDKKNHHCFQPLLYQVATAALSPADVAWPIRSILSDQANTTVLMSEVTSVDPAGQVVTTAHGMVVRYDYLVVATGVTTSYFNHPEWAKYAPGLKTIEDATRIRARILTCFETAERTDDQNVRRKSMTFVIVGGGPTGVELAGSIADIARNVLARDFRHINPRNARILLIEAGDRLLSTFTPEMSDYARKSLEELGVEVLTGASVNECAEDSVLLSNGQKLDCCSIGRQVFGRHRLPRGSKLQPIASAGSLSTSFSGSRPMRTFSQSGTSPQAKATASRFRGWRQRRSKWDVMWVSTSQNV